MTQENKSLYELSHELIPLEALLETQGGDVTGQEALVEHVTGLLDRVQDKVDSLGRYYINYKMLADTLEIEETRIRERRQVIENKIRRLKEAVKQSMEMRRILKVEGKLFTFSVQGNGGKQPVKLLVPEDQVPDSYITLRREIDMQKLRDDLLNGNQEACRIAEFVEPGTNIRIK